MIAGQGYAVRNVDSVLIAQAPKISPLIDDMISNISRALRIERDQVMVKATTTDGLGFTGRGEGMAAYAVAMVEQ
jgi:2-C-methyl-D-erythritol 2,4-cyclodiphosphate synthase